jgi:hypothetical protein
MNLVADENIVGGWGAHLHPDNGSRGCFLGVDIAENAGTKALVEGYKSFHARSSCIEP